MGYRRKWTAYRTAVRRGNARQICNGGSMSDETVQPECRVRLAGREQRRYNHWYIKIASAAL
jgi:hypothetical protein